MAAGCGLFAGRFFDAQFADSAIVMFEGRDWKREIPGNNGKLREFKGFVAESPAGFEFGNFLRRHPENEMGFGKFSPRRFFAGHIVSRIEPEIKIPRKRFIRVLKRDCVAILLRTHPLAPTVESVGHGNACWRPP